MYNATVPGQFGHWSVYRRRAAGSNNLDTGSFPLFTKEFDPLFTVHEDTNDAIRARKSVSTDLRHSDFAGFAAAGTGFVVFHRSLASKTH